MFLIDGLLFKKYAGAVVRSGLNLLSGYLVEHGFVTQADATSIVAALVPAIVSLLWSLYDKKRAHVEINTALELPAGSSPEKLKATIAAGNGATI